MSDLQITVGVATALLIILLAARVEWREAQERRAISARTASWMAWVNGQCALERRCKERQTAGRCVVTEISRAGSYISDRRN